MRKTLVLCLGLLSCKAVASSSQTPKEEIQESQSKKRCLSDDEKMEILLKHVKRTLDTIPEGEREPEDFNFEDALSDFFRECSDLSKD